MVMKLHIGVACHLGSVSNNRPQTGPQTPSQRRESGVITATRNYEDHRQASNNINQYDQDIRWLKTEGGIDAVRLPVGLPGAIGLSTNTSVSSGLMMTRFRLHGLGQVLLAFRFSTC